jgi:ubiquinone/menaquinone biosynthesis C-methylase UbiE
MSEKKQVFEFDENVARQLHLLFGTEALKKLRKTYFDLFDVRAGDHVLDVGCGTGANAIALVEYMEGNCTVDGLDSSEAMLAIGRKNLQNFPHAEKITLHSGDAHRLPFADRSFDCAMVIQVLEYSKEPARLLQEIQRVLRPGGKVLVADTDWDTIVWNSNQKEKTRRIVVLWSDHEADGWQGRRIPELLRRSSFRNIQGGVYTISESSFAETDYSFLVTQIIVDYLVRAEKMSQAELDDWMADLKRKDREGHFYFSLNRYAFIGYRS